MRENKRKGMPKVKQLVYRHYPWLEKHFENWFEESTLKEYKHDYTKLYAKTCWACKLGAPIHFEFFRCHILPLCEGGNNDYTNLHLLCDECHKESEHLNGQAYWTWFYDRPSQPSMTFLAGLKKAARIQVLYESGNFDSIPEDFLPKLHKLYDEHRVMRQYNEKYAMYHQVFNPFNPVYSRSAV